MVSSMICVDDRWVFLVGWIVLVGVFDVMVLEW